MADDPGTQPPTEGDHKAGVPLVERAPETWRPPARSGPGTKPPKKVDDEPDGDDGDNGETKGESKDDASPGDGGSKKEADPSAKPGTEPPATPFYKRPVLMIILITVLLVAVVGAVLYWLHARKHESTDDAFVDGHIVQISPKISGQIKRVLIDDNQEVQAGQLLVEIDDRDIVANLAQAQASAKAAATKQKEAETNVELTRKNTAAQLRQAEAAVSVARAAVETAKSQAASARADVVAAEAASQRAADDLKRYQSLDPRAIGQQQIDQSTADARTSAASLSATKTKVTAADSGIVEAQAKVLQAEGGLDAAKAALAQVDVAQAQAENAAAEVQRAQAVVARSKLDLEYTRILAPRAGRVTRRMAEPGAYVAINGALLAIVEPDVWVTANFKETQLRSMRPGQAVAIKVDAYKDHSFTGKVDSIQQGTGARFSLLPPENATGNYVKVVQRVPVKIVFDPAPDRPLGPGMSVVPDVTVKD